MLQPGIPHGGLVKAHDGAFATALGFEQFLAEVLFKVVGALVRAVDGDLHVVAARRQYALAQGGLGDHPFHHKAARLGVLDREPTHAADWLVQFEAQGPLVGVDVIGPVAFEPRFAGCTCLAEGQADGDDVVFVLHDHATFHGAVACCGQGLPVRFREGQL